MEKVCIYRQQLFLKSETFIYNQLRALKTFDPVLAGCELFGDVLTDIKCIYPRRHKSSSYQILRRLSFDPNEFIVNLKSEHVGVIHAHFGLDAVDAVKIKLGMKVPLITTYHGFDATVTRKDLLKSLKPSYIKYWYHENSVMKHSDKIICVSDFIRGSLLKRGYSEDKLITHYIGIPVFESDIELKSKPFILHVGRLVEKKGTQYLVKAFKSVSKKFKDFELVIVGDGPLKQELIILTNELGLTNRVRFLGARPHYEVLQLMKEAYVFCVPSVRAKNGDSEGLGMVFLESQSYKVPVVSTFHGGIPEAVKHGETGILCRERNVEDLEDALMQLILSETVRRKFGDSGYQYINEKFNIEQQTIDLEKIYSSLI